MSIAPSTTIGILTSGLAYGGAEHQLVHLALGLRARGWDVRILSMLPPIAFTDRLDAAGVPWASLQMRRGVPSLRALLATMRWLRASGINALLTFNYPADILGRIAGRLVGLPLIVACLRSIFFGGRHRDLILRLSDPLVNISVVNSSIVAGRLAARGVVPAHRLTVIPNGIATERFVVPPAQARAARHALTLPRDAFFWLAVGRLDTPKDYANLFAGLAQLRTMTPPPCICIAGEGPLASTLAAQAVALGVSDRVRFLGLRRDIPDLLNAADALVLSSAWEGLPNAIMEAMAAGLPVVSTDVGGVRELVQDGTNGYVVPPRDPLALADAMRRLMALPIAERQAMGLAGQSRIRDGFEMARVIDRWEDLLRIRLHGQSMGSSS